MSEIHTMQQLVFAFSIAHTLRMLVKHWSDAMYFRELIALSMALQMSQYVRLAAVIEMFFFCCCISLSVVIQCLGKIFTLKWEMLALFLQMDHSHNKHYNVHNCFLSLLQSPSMTGNICTSFLSCGFIVWDYWLFVMIYNCKILWCFKTMKRSWRHLNESNKCIVWVCVIPKERATADTGIFPTGSLPKKNWQQSQYFLL